MKKNIKYFFEAILLYFFFIVAKIVGLSFSRKIFSFIFRKVGHIVRSNKIIKENLLRYSPELSAQKTKEIISNMWANYGMTFVEYVFLKRFRNKNHHIIIEGENILNEIKKNNKPVIFVSGHFANFELMSMEITKKEIKLATIYRPLNNFLLNPFMEYLRKKFVCKNQIKKGRQNIKEILEFIDQKHSIALMIDQRVSEGDKIKFFNEEAYTTTLPAQLAFKYDLKVVPIFIERKEDKFFLMKIYNPLNVSSFKDKTELTEKLNQLLEQMIRKNPNQWIWSHNRWR